MRGERSASDKPLPVTLAADLTDADREAIIALRTAVYPPGEMADWPGHKVQWSIPELCIRSIGDDSALLCFAGLYLRNAEHNGQPVLVGGIGNVKTHPLARRRGLASECCRRAVEFFRESNADFGLLVCDPALMKFYADMGWCAFGGRLLIRQHGKLTEFTFMRVMTQSIGSEASVDGTIDLCGPPW